MQALPNPRRFNSGGNSRYAANRAERIYQIMVRRGILIEEYDAVIKEKEEEKEKDMKDMKDDEVLMFPGQIA